MVWTFNRIYSEVQEQVQDDSATTLVLIKNAINSGQAKFGAVLNREWRVSYKRFSIAQDQQYYQLPPDCIRPGTLTVTVGSVVYPLEEVPDEQSWQDLNMQSQSSSVPRFFFVRGSNEVGIWPIPSADLTNGGTLGYERTMKIMAADDYTTGTVAVTAGSASITGSGTTFTATMIGRTLVVDDANGDGQAYLIDSRNSATVIGLDNYYGGATQTGLTYRIGEVPDIPGEFHESLVDYACYRVYKRRRDPGAYRDMKAAFDEAVKLCEATYGSKTTSQYIRPIKTPRGGYVHDRTRNYQI